MATKKTTTKKTTTKKASSKKPVEAAADPSVDVQPEPSAESADVPAEEPVDATPDEAPQAVFEEREPDDDDESEPISHGVRRGYYRLGEQIIRVVAVEPGEVLPMMVTFISAPNCDLEKMKGSDAPPMLIYRSCQNIEAFKEVPWKEIPKSEVSPAWRKALARSKA